MTTEIIEKRDSLVRPGPDGGVWGWRNLVGFAQNQTSFLTDLMKSHGDVCYFNLGSMQVCLLSEPDLVREVLVTKSSSFEKGEKDRYIMGRFLGKGLVTSEGDLHKRQRKLSQPAFRKKRISLYADAMCRQTERVLSEWKDGDEFDMVKEMMHLTMFIVTETLFQIDVSEKSEAIGESIETLQDVANKDFQTPWKISYWWPIPRNIRANRALQFVRGTIDEMIATRRAEEAAGEWEDRGDLLSALIHASDEETGERMSDEQLRDELITLFVAGHETTSNALAWTWYLLSQHPEIEAKLHEELDRVLGEKPVTLEDLPRLPYVQKVLKESMRLYPPAWILNARCATEDVMIGEWLIKKGTYVFMSPYVMHRREDVFPDAEAFDPERFSPEQEKERNRFAYIPFGAGHRVCIGNAFAMMEASLILARIAQTYRVEMLPGQKVERLSQITMSPKNGLQMKLHKREPVQASASTEQADTNEPQAVSGCPFH